MATVLRDHRSQENVSTAVIKTAGALKFLSFHLVFNRSGTLYCWKYLIVKVTSRKRLPTEVNRMLHMADVRCAGDYGEVEFLACTWKTTRWFCWIFIRALCFLTDIEWRQQRGSKLVVSLLVFPGQAAFNVSTYHCYFVFCGQIVPSRWALRASFAGLNSLSLKTSCWNFRIFELSINPGQLELLPLNYDWIRIFSVVGASFDLQST